MKKAVVSGATGFIGKNLVFKLVKEGVDVLAVVRDKKKAEALFSCYPEVKILTCPLEEYDILFNSAGESADVFFHLAWEGVYGPLRNDSAVQSMNVKALEKAFKTAEKWGCKRFIGLGTIMEKEVEAIEKEGREVPPSYLYGQMKIKGHQKIEELSQKSRMEVMWLMPVNVYGPGDCSTRLISSTIEKGITGKPLEFTEGRQMSDFIYIDDFTDALLLASEKGRPGSYLVGSNSPKPLREYLEILMKNLNRKAKYGVIPYNGSLMDATCFDSRPFEKDTGFLTKVNFSDGTEKTIAAFRNRKKRNVIVVGCGLSGSVIARILSEQGYKVKIIEKRNTIGGNLYDEKEEHGFLVHRYGPHSFHTDRKEVMDFISRFSNWQEYHLKCGASFDGNCTPTPFNFKTVDTYFPNEKEEIRTSFRKEYKDRKTITVVEALNAESEKIREYARYLYENDYSLYTAKQWGISPEEIDPSVLKRVPLRLNYEEGYFDEPYQVLPEHSYSEFFENLLNHPNIDIILNKDFMDGIKIEEDRILYESEEVEVIYTGELDKLFSYCYGKLPYRSLRFEWKYTEVDSFQKYPVVAYPKEKGYTRISEYKKLPIQKKKGSILAYEYPLPYEEGKDEEPYYPILTEKSKETYNRYLEKAKEIRNLSLSGRLADFQYYDMDDAIIRAMEVAENFLHKKI